MAADIVFPEKMEQLDGKSAEEKIKILEDYIRYMTERVDFAFSGYTTKANFKNSVASSIDDVVDEKGFITAPIATQITKDTINVTYLNSMSIKAGSVEAGGITLKTGTYEAQSWSAEKLAVIRSCMLGYTTQAEAIRNGGDINGDGVVDGVDLAIVRSAMLGYYLWNKNGGTYTANLKCENAFKVISVLDNGKLAFSAGVNGITTRNIAADGMINVIQNGDSKTIMDAEGFKVGSAALKSTGLSVTFAEGTKNLTSANQTWADGVVVDVPSSGYYIVIATFKSMGNYSLYDCSGRAGVVNSLGSFNEIDRFELSSNGSSIWYLDSKSQVVAVKNLMEGEKVKAQFWANAAGAVVETKVKLYRLG